LGLESDQAIIGYEFGDFIRDIETASAPAPKPIDAIGRNTQLRIFLRGVAQRCLDGLILDCLFPRVVLEQLLNILLEHRRLILFGATGIGKSNLARQLAKYISLKICSVKDGCNSGIETTAGTSVAAQECVVEIKIGDEEPDRNMAQVRIGFEMR
uniref:Adapter protein unc-53 (inferred by orthology to a C. elegans protein) n=1 Tax=Anisakis simplex TaxID=6269 RepID=A0A0M3JEL2_ANISI